ncbi:hypothetical protein DRJ48_00625 [Candidatus Woesearchaeota archaeon]|nr:MAG: hypothetical protein DRJ48_00625 [Candidatus Woesearchaeota archaeon]
MKRVFALVLAALLLVPAALATSVGTGIGVTMETEDFKPLIWLCDARKVKDDNVQTGRVSDGGEKLVERINNYAFEGEKIKWKVLVMDKNGIEKISDVFVTIGSVQGEGNDIEANCVLDHVLVKDEEIKKKCNARIGEEELEYAPEDNIMAYYTCTLTVEPADSMYGEYWVTAEVEDLDGLSSTFDENEYWFFNPVIALSIDGTVDFGVVRPGTTAYSDTLLVGNDADAGSGVMLDMFITGTDFYDPYSSGAKCPTTNQLSLKNFAYYAVNGAYSTAQDPRSDAEGYVGITYGDHWDPTLYDVAEILQVQQVGPYYTANILAPGAEMALTFRLNLPEPCNGDFSDGQIYFWGEAI